MATGLHGREIPGFEARSGVPNSENPAMNGNQVATRQPGADLRLGHPDADQVLATHHSVRFAGELSDSSLDRGDLWLHNDH